MSNRVLNFTLVLALVGTLAQARGYRRRYKYYLDANHAEEVLAGITLNNRLYDDEWLGIIGNRKGDTYTVRRGDTLWGIAGREFSNPRLWRKLWEVNPYLTNPHELTVGQILTYYNNNDQRDEPPLRIPLIRLTPSGVNDLDNDSFVNTDYKNRYRPALIVVTDNDVLGQITGGYTEKTAFDEHDEVFVNFFGDRPKIGDKFAAVKFERVLKDRTKVSSPVIGTLVRMVGEVVVVGSGNKLSKVSITALTGPIRRGDRIIAMQKPVNWAAAFNPPEDLTARIVAGEEPGHKLFAQGEIILLNKGSQDGVKTGFLFRVYRDRDPLTRRSVDVEPDFKADVQVIFTGAQSSVGYILRNKDTLRVGDMIVPTQTFPNPPPPPTRSTQTIELD